MQRNLRKLQFLQLAYLNDEESRQYMLRRWLGLDNLDERVDTLSTRIDELEDWLDDVDQHLGDLDDLVEEHASEEQLQYEIRQIRAEVDAVKETVSSDEPAPSRERTFTGGETEVLRVLFRDDRFLTASEIACALGKPEKANSVRKFLSDLKRKGVNFETRQDGRQKAYRLAADANQALAEGTPLNRQRT